MQVLVLSAKFLDGMGVSLGSPTAAGNRDAASTGVARQAAPPKVVGDLKPRQVLMLQVLVYKRRRARS